jgi:hypothetical protein
VHAELLIGHGFRTIEDVAEVIHRDLTSVCEGMALASGGVAASNAMPLGDVTPSRAARSAATESARVQWPSLRRSAR